jgi:inner membrane protein
MGPHGHAGLTLIIFSFLMMPFGYRFESIIIIIVATALSSIPDIDLICGWKHRDKTHNIGFGLLVGVGIAIIFFYTMHDIVMALTGFIAGFGGVISHLLGDIITYKSFAPLAPFSKRKIGLKYCKADDKKVNIGLVIGGTLAFTLYMLVVTGNLEVIIQNLLLN